MNDPFSLKPVIWIRSSRRDFRELPGDVKSHVGYALNVAQQGGKHRDAKPLKGFGGAGVVEIVKDYHGDTFRTVLRFASQEPSMFSTSFRRNRRKEAKLRRSISS